MKEHAENQDTFFEYKNTRRNIINYTNVSADTASVYFVQMLSLKFKLLNPLFVLNE